MNPLKKYLIVGAAIAALVAALFLAGYIKALADGKKSAEEALQKIKSESAALKIETRAKNAELARQDAQRETETTLAIADQIERIKTHYADLLKKERARRAAHPAAGLVRQPARAGGGEGGMPGVSLAAERPAQDGPDPDPAAAGRSAEIALEQACAITTAQYNGLWESWQAACDAQPGRCR